MPSRLVVIRVEGKASIEILGDILLPRLTQHIFSAWVELIPLLPVDYEIFQKANVGFWIAGHYFVLVNTDFVNFLQWFEFVSSIGNLDSKLDLMPVLNEENKHSDE